MFLSKWVPAEAVVTHPRRGMHACMHMGGGAVVFKQHACSMPLGRDEVFMSGPAACKWQSNNMGAVPLPSGQA